ncbi:hypothetical protein VTN49DRAFT_6189 [Thermomyces lanuginosus]|uniref:uncharacterized protein n=1 Tax=Thermomyces lanuginosus TaxID=5541 RepID=UPI0037443B68
MSSTIQQYTTRLDGIDNLQKVEVPRSAPGPGEVLVRIKAVSLNYRDAEVIRGEYTHHRSVTGSGGAAAIVPCSDMCGVIEQVGTDVTRWTVGDRVLSTFLPEHRSGPIREEALASGLGLPRDGVLATHRVFKEHELVPAPAALSDQEACTLPIAYVTAWMALNGREPLNPDKYVLLQGTGGVSIAGLLLAKAAGAKVIITSSSDDKLARAKNELGADFTINYRTTPDWDRAVLDLTSGHGADIILETGGEKTLPKSFCCAAYGGLINCIGYTSGKSQSVEQQQLNINVLAISKALTLQGILNGPTDRFEELIRFVEKHEIRPVICKVFAFEQAKEALKYLESGSHFGKVVIEVSR